MESKYYSLTELIQMMSSPNDITCQMIVSDNYELFRQAYGSTSNHQAWQGGYWDHITEAMNLWVLLFEALEGTGRLEQLQEDERYNLSDGLLVLFLHDLEKPWRLVMADGEIVKDSTGRPLVKPELFEKSARKLFVQNSLKEYGIQLSPQQENALKYVEGMRDADYAPGQRIMLPLAALCHCCDLLSARLFYDFPLELGDSWGAKRAKSS